MPIARCNGIEIEYETFGDRADAPLLLIMGLGAQMILWYDDFCEELAGRGHFVVRFDNRDVGGSTKLTHFGVPDVASAMAAAAAGQAVDAPYRLSDMAADAADLLNHLDIERVHVVGASMGGMIAQTLAIEYPQRVYALTSIMSTTGDPALPPPNPEALAALLAPPPTTREQAGERAVELLRMIGSPGFPHETETMRELGMRAWDRGLDAGGVARQLVAVVASGSRAQALGSVRVPSLVIHGTDDPLIPVEAGVATARALPHAEELLIEGMGHDYPRQVWPQIIDAITRTTKAGRG